MTYTFDEAIDKILFDSFEDTHDYDVVYTEDVVSLIKKLKEEYAPTIEMTKKQYEILVMSKNNAVDRVDKVGLFEFMSAYSLLNQEIDHLSLMKAWLHPEAINVVDE